MVSDSNFLERYFRDKLLDPLDELNELAERLDGMDSDLYLSQMDGLNARARELRRQRRGILEKTGEDEQIRRTEEMLDYLENSNGWIEELDPIIFSVLIDRLYLTADGNIRIRLQNGLEVEEALTTEVR